ncbi:MAG: hypothetical protein ACQEQF_01850 [Bacillota bacterium]
MNEIENKYFLDYLSADLLEQKIVDRYKVKQYYIVNKDNHEIRIRKISNNKENCKLCYKYGQGLKREEKEITLPYNSFERLYEGQNMIVKNIIEILYKDKIIELELYEEPANLIIAEIEFNSVKESFYFDPPNFLECKDGKIRNVTNYEEFKNKNIAKNKGVDTIATC